MTERKFYQKVIEFSRFGDNTFEFIHIQNIFDVIFGSLVEAEVAGFFVFFTHADARLGYLKLKSTLQG